MINNGKIRADAVIFDKDGTLIDFDAFWISLSDLALKALLKQLNQSVYLADDILAAFGVQGNTVDINGILCKGTYREMAETAHRILQHHGCEADCDTVERMMLSAYNSHAHLGNVQPTCENLRQVLETLKQRGKKIALVTTDNMEITRMCLKKLDIASLFDCLYADGGALPPKPDPAAALDICAREKLQPEHVVMVGDTMTDIRFARNAGIRAIAVAKHEESRALLQGHADAVIHDLSGLLDILA